jgi:hypothetical protein
VTLVAISPSRDSVFRCLLPCQSIESGLPEVSSLRYLLLAVSDTPKPENYPSQEDFILLLQDLRRRIERLLQRDGRPPETDSPLLREAVLAITHGWRRGLDREQESLDGIEKADIPPEPESPSPKDPGDDDEPPPARSALPRRTL